MANLASIETISGDLQKVLQQVADDNIGKESLILQKITMDILTQTVKNTRFDTGALLNNWQVSRNLRNRRIKKNKVRYDKSGRVAIRIANREAMRIRTTDTVYIQNNLEYASTYEKKDKMLYKAIKKVTRDLSNGR